MIFCTEKHGEDNLQNTKILLINPTKGFYKKKIDRELNVNQLNFGLLAIASKFPDYVYIYDCQGKDFDDAIHEIAEIVTLNKITIVGISLISAYSEKCAFSIARHIHEKFHNIDIVYGGKDHAPYIAKDLIDSHHATAVVRYDGESFIDDIVYKKLKIHDSNVIYRDSNGELIENKKDLQPCDLCEYDHTLYPEHTKFVPSIEISRGCNNDCIFCSNNRTKQTRKSIDVIINEISKIKTAYGKSICAYFQTPHFLLPKDDLKALAKCRDNNDEFIWRTQTSVRYLTPENIQLLYDAGARVIDVGFESASPEILTHMGKDKKPTEYIAIMKDALKTSAKVGLRIKLNILLFVGETRTSLTETANFLKDNLHEFHSFSAYPVMVYPCPNRQKFIAKIEELGGSLSPAQTSKNIYCVNLGPQIDHENANNIAILLGKAFQSDEMYMSQRNIGYLPRCQQVDISSLASNNSPFYTSIAEKEQAIQDLYKTIGGLE